MAESKEQYEQRMIKELGDLPNRLKGLTNYGERLRLPTSNEMLEKAILDTDKEIRGIQNILGEIKIALKLGKKKIQLTGSLEMANEVYNALSQLGETSSAYAIGNDVYCSVGIERQGTTIYSGKELEQDKLIENSIGIKLKIKDRLEKTVSHFKK